MALLLRPSMLDDLGLIPALRWQAREVTRRTGLPVKMVADDIADGLLDSHRTCLYRFVRKRSTTARNTPGTQVSRRARGPGWAFRVCSRQRRWF
jgi:signal transduction histidine kinase